jgi:hypothetical protein
LGYGGCAASAYFYLTSLYECVISFLQHASV